MLRSIPNLEGEVALPQGGEPLIGRFLIFYRLIFKLDTSSKSRRYSNITIN